LNKNFADKSQMHYLIFKYLHALCFQQTEITMIEYLCSVSV